MLTNVPRFIFGMQGVQGGSVLLGEQVESGSVVGSFCHGSHIVQCEASTNGLFLRCGGYLCNARIPSGVRVVSKALMGGPDVSLYCEYSAYLSGFSGDGQVRYSRRPLTVY